MNSNPRNVALALATAGALVAGLTACGTTSKHPTQGGTHNVTPAYPDCDLGDLREGDKDCKDPRAFADAVREYGRSKVNRAVEEYNKKIAPKVTPPKSVPTTRPGVPGTRKSATPIRK